MEDQDKLTALIMHDPVVSIMFAAAILLIVLDGSFASIAVHTKHIELLKIPMLATGAFAIAGIVLGLLRSLRPKSDRAA
jgi:TRAP-type C4-dicarboxylate transport system permease small subunit